jgi:Skp family chaperone for outer membrane proteins
MNQDLQSAQTFVTITREKLSSKSIALDESVKQEHEAQIKLQTLVDEKKAKEQLLESTQMTLSKRDFTSSVMSSSAVAHAMALVKSHMSDFDVEILQRDFPINDEERDALVDSIYDTAQYFASQYDFSILVESDDNASPDT